MTKKQTVYVIMAHFDYEPSILGGVFTTKKEAKNSIKVYKQKGIGYIVKNETLFIKADDYEIIPRTLNQID